MKTVWKRRRSKHTARAPAPTRENVGAAAEAKPKEVDAAAEPQHHEVEVPSSAVACGRNKKFLQHHGGNKGLPNTNHNVIRKRSSKQALDSDASMARANFKKRSKCFAFGAQVDPGPWYIVRAHPHLGMGLKIGKNYSEMFLQKKCNEDPVRLEKLNKALKDSFIFERDTKEDINKATAAGSASGADVETNIQSRLLAQPAAGKSMARAAVAMGTALGHQLQNQGSRNKRNAGQHQAHGEEESSAKLQATCAKPQPKRRRSASAKPNVMQEANLMVPNSIPASCCISGTSKSSTHYSCLGISMGASMHDVRRAYRNRVLETHPDKGGTNSAFRMVHEAFKVLGDAVARAAYDHQLGIDTSFAEGVHNREPQDSVHGCHGVVLLGQLLELMAADIPARLHEMPAATLEDLLKNLGALMQQFKKDTFLVSLRGHGHRSNTSGILSAKPGWYYVQLQFATMKCVTLETLSLAQAADWHADLLSIFVKVRQAMCRMGFDDAMMLLERSQAQSNTTYRFQANVTHCHVRFWTTFSLDLRTVLKYRKSLLAAAGDKNRSLAQRKDDVKGLQTAMASNLKTLRAASQAGDRQDSGTSQDSH